MIPARRNLFFKTIKCLMSKFGLSKYETGEIMLSLVPPGSHALSALLEWGWITGWAQPSTVRSGNWSNAILPSQELSEY